MKANELRIGNIIRYSRNEDLNLRLHGTFLTVDIDTITYLESDDRPDFYEAVLLTPEILEKFGLSNHKRSVSFADSGYDPNVFWYFLDWVDDCNQRIFKHGFVLGQFRDKFYYQAGNRRKIGIEIKYLHQLQNIYFALTGEELTINL